MNLNKTVYKKTGYQVDRDYLATLKVWSESKIGHHKTEHELYKP
jgi:hypothetical protein